MVVGCVHRRDLSKRGRNRPAGPARGNGHSFSVADRPRDSARPDVGPIHDADCAITVATVGQWQSTRPQLATLVLYAVTLAFSDRAWLPLVFVVWANLHGGWILGL